MHLKNNSSVSSNRIIKNKKDLIETPVRYLNNAKVELYKTLPFGNYICKSTFDKYTKAEHHIKKIERKTDVCDFCDWMRVKSKSIVNFCREFSDFAMLEGFNMMKLTGVMLYNTNEKIIRNIN